MIVYDVGCHRGEDAEYYLKRGFKVVAFECAPPNVEFLKREFKDDIAAGRMVIESRALLKNGGAGKQARFFLDNVSIWGTLQPDWRERNQRLGSEALEISVETLDPASAYSLYGHPYYMKIDVEGVDMDVLHSLGALSLSERPSYVSIESSKTCWDSLVREFQVFAELGYDRFQVVGQRGNHHKVTGWRDASGAMVEFRHKRDSSGPFGADLKGSGWITAEQALQKYRLIFLLYKLFGDDGLFAVRKVRPRWLRSFYARVLRTLHLKDWYDTHAMKGG